MSKNKVAPLAHDPTDSLTALGHPVVMIDSGTGHSATDFRERSFATWTPTVASLDHLIDRVRLETILLLHVAIELPDFSF
jgi:hypothetical protein